jgi:hypothetical protein
MSEKVEKPKVRVKKNESILGKIKLFFEEIPDSKPNRKKSVNVRTLKRSKIARK